MISMGNTGNMMGGAGVSNQSLLFLFDPAPHRRACSARHLGRNLVDVPGVLPPHARTPRAVVALSSRKSVSSLMHLKYCSRPSAIASRTVVATCSMPPAGSGAAHSSHNMRGGPTESVAG